MHNIDNVNNINFKETFGGIPSGVMKFKKDKDLLKFIDNDKTELNDVTKNKVKPRGGGYAKNIKFSTYNPVQAKFILEYYTNDGDIILDPFMGRGTRSQISLALNRKYVGYDIDPLVVELNKKLSEKNNFNTNVKYFCGDGTDLSEVLSLKLKFDCVFSCPPYYFVEKYTKLDNDLSTLTIDEFNNRIDRMFSRLYNLIKTSNYSNKEFYPIIFTVGTIRLGNRGVVDMDRVFQNLALKNNFILHDKLITENLSPGAGFTFRRNYTYKFLNKNYETTLIFMKYD